MPETQAKPSVWKMKDLVGPGGLSDSAGDDHVKRMNNEKNWNDAVVKETIYFESDSRERGVITNSCV